MNRRTALQLLGWGGAGFVLGGAGDVRPAPARAPRPDGQAAGDLAWNSGGPLVAYPEKLPLIVLTDRPVQLETPRQYFRHGFTDNAAFFVRWHLDLHPNAIDLSVWRLNVEGNITRSLSLSLDDLVNRFTPVSVAAVNQCSGNSRNRFEPRVPGGQWGNGAMGCATWTGVRLRELLEMAGVQPGSIEVQFEGLDRGRGPVGRGSHRFLKSLRLDDPVLDECLVAYGMNGQQLPMLNGFPVRLVAPGYFATYWMKSLTWIRVLTQPDENFWMKSGYRIPDTPRGSTTPEDVRAGRMTTLPITRMPVRSFIVSPDGSARLPAGLPAMVRGVAFSGNGAITGVELSEDGGRSWREVTLGADHGPHAFRTWEATWTPRAPGEVTLAVRATDAGGEVQPDAPVWNSGGYLWNRIERQVV
ncbi:MAG: molybdopterin-dependent oxidoreductase, partial [Gemmatimonadetes bacterium]|nr:molybdopterin-dependent oxidoreductase [Gemmatimonadota bacterium]